MNKNPIKFKGEVLVEVKTEKKQRDITHSHNREQKHSPLLGLDWLDKLEIGLQGSKKNVIRDVEEDE